MSRRATADGGQHLPEHAAGGGGHGNADGVVEGQTEGLVDILAAFAAVEQVLLDVIADGEQIAARGVGRRVHAVGACHSAGKGAYMVRKVAKGRLG